MKTRQAILRATGVILLIYMMCFASCDTVSYCWVCEHPRDSSDHQTVCNSMSKSKLESYGYICTPY
ncbi:MAG: hypothetical protein P1P83_07780 [Bacteroidales bacterium]|nr:hypothetical protein [Bacteroidales bacterium]MDT8374459.1 hypothetical protein [Bacteroidales bacterium]